MFRLLLLAICLCLNSIVWAQWHCNPSTEDLLKLGFPVVEIQTVDNEEPTFTSVTPPEGAFGKGILSENVSGRMTIVDAEGTQYDSGEYMEDVSGITLKIRGNTSAYGNIKPYKINLQTKADLLHRGNDETYADKDWILINGDKMNTVVGFKVSELVGMSWTPAYKFVHVVLNGQFRGLYLLMESVKRNPRCRLNVDKESGYIFEHDAYWWKENVYLLSDAGRYYTIKYPKEDDQTEQRLHLLQKIINDMETSILTGSYESVIDTHSFARWLLAHDIIGNRDAAGSNIFFAKYDDTEDSKVTMPLLWDFDMTLSRPEEWASIHTNTYGFFKDLLDSPNDGFKREYVELWNNRSDEIFTEMLSFLYNLLSSSQLSNLEQSRQLIMQLFAYEDSTWEEDIRYCISWFEGRKEWLGTSIQQIEENMLDGVTITISSTAPTTYDLMGRPTKVGSKGIRVQQGRKYFSY